jgi:hypothetical protein
MAGHFVLNQLTHQEPEDIQNAWLSDGPTVPILGPLQHAAGTDNGMGRNTNFPGWDVNSRAVLTGALEGNNLADRSGLPPHRYLVFGVGDIKVGHSANYIQLNRANGWPCRLLRPAEWAPISL